MKTHEHLKDIGKKIKELRTMKGISPKELASDINITPQALGKIERGETDLSLTRLFQICQSLQVMPKEVFMG